MNNIEANRRNKRCITQLVVVFCPYDKGETRAMLPISSVLRESQVQCVHYLDSLGETVTIAVIDMTIFLENPINLSRKISAISCLS